MEFLIWHNYFSQIAVAPQTTPPVAETGRPISSLGVAALDEAERRLDDVLHDGGAQTLGVGVDGKNSGSSLSTCSVRVMRS